MTLFQFPDHNYSRGRYEKCFAPFHSRNKPESYKRCQTTAVNSIQCAPINNLSVQKQQQLLLKSRILHDNRQCPFGCIFSALSNCKTLFKQFPAHIFPPAPFAIHNAPFAIHKRARRGSNPRHPAQPRAKKNFFCF